MPIAPERHPGAVRQTWRAALCLAAVAATALAAWHAAPDQVEAGRFGVLLALGLAGFAAAEPGVILYRPWDALCEGDRCHTRGAGGPWYSDPSHLTAAGGAIQAEAFVRALDGRVPDEG